MLKFVMDENLNYCSRQKPTNLI